MSTRQDRPAEGTSSISGALLTLLRHRWPIWICLFSWKFLLRESPPGRWAEYGGMWDWLSLSLWRLTCLGMSLHTFFSTCFGTWLGTSLHSDLGTCCNWIKLDTLHVTRYTWQSDNKVSIWHLKIDHVGKIHNYFCQVIICNLGTRMSNGDLKSSHVTRVDWSRVCKSKCWWDTRQSNNPAYWPGRPRAPLSLRRDCIVLWAPAANTHW